MRNRARFVLAQGLLAGAAGLLLVPAHGAAPPEQVLVTPKLRDRPVPPQNPYAACTPESIAQGPGAPLTVEVRDSSGPFRADQVVTVSDLSGWPVVTVGCNGPFDIFHLNPGSYRVVASVGKWRSEEVTVTVPPNGARITLTLKPPPGWRPQADIAG